MTIVLDLVLATALVALAISIATARQDRDAILSFVAMGLLLGLGWARLSALDIALTEIAIGGGATGLLLLRAEAFLQTAPATARAPGRGATWCAIIGCSAISAGLAYAVLTLPSPQPSLAPLAASQIHATGLGNPVTAVLLAYRSLDTLLEKVVLLIALLGIWSLATDRHWGGAPVLRPEIVPAPLDYLARVLPPFGIVVGAYMFWVGADAPGGTFQAATVLAAMWLVVMMAGIAPPPANHRRLLRLTLVFGPTVFLGIGLLGFAAGGSFLALPPHFAKPLILVIEAALTLSVAATLAMLVAGPARGEPPP